MPIELSNLSESSKSIYEKFFDDNKDRKEVDYHDVFELIARGASILSVLKNNKGKKLTDDEQRAMLTDLFNSLVKDDMNDFQDDPRIASVIDTVIKLRNGEFTIDVGRQGMGCIPCLSSVKISAKK